MTFWLGVIVAYVVLIAAGLSLGRYLAERYDGRGDGPAHDPFPTEPIAPPPGFAMDVPPLGSPFDRALLPGAFEELSGSAGTAVH